jgi:hypothetical protein
MCDLYLEKLQGVASLAQTTPGSNGSTTNERERLLA